MQIIAAYQQKQMSRVKKLINYVSNEYKKWICRSKAQSFYTLLKAKLCRNDINWYIIPNGKSNKFKSLLSFTSTEHCTSFKDIFHFQNLRLCLDGDHSFFASKWFCSKIEISLGCYKNQNDFDFFSRLFKSTGGYPCVWQRVKYECHCDFFPIELLYSNSVVWQNRIELMYICNTDDQNPSFVTPTGGRTHVLPTSITYIF